jgi:5-methylcytosine-specific restriction endonuclease McrA
MEISVEKEGGVSRLVTKAGKCVVCGQPITARDEQELKDILRGVLKTCEDCIGLDLDLEPPTQKASKGRIIHRVYLQTKEWRDKRLKALKRAGYACQICKAVDELDVHHNTYERLGREYLSDLVVLCRTCHDVFHERLPGKSSRVGRDKEERTFHRRRRK